MVTLTGVWTVFCGESNSTYDNSDSGKNSGSSSLLGSTLFAITHSSSCVDHGIIISVDLLLGFMFLFNFINKGSRASPAAIPQRNSCLEKFSAIFNGGLGLAYLGLSFWILEDKGEVLPLHQWLVQLTQGLTWTFLSLTVSLRSRQLAKVFVRVWSAISCLLAGFLCISAFSFAVTNRKVSMETVLDVLSLPGAILLLLSAYNGSKSAASDHTVDETLYMHLNGESAAEIKSERSVSPFATAGLLSRLSFWWLNPLMKRGWEKPLDEKDLPLLAKEDQAESCYALFNRQTQAKQSPSIFWTLISCHRREILISGFFALLKIVTLSSGPLLLNAFIKVAEGEEAFRYEGYVLAGSLFFAKILESLSQRQWYFRTRRIGLQLRSLLSAAIYRKQLRLSNEAKMVHSTGEVMNYVTVDAYRIGEFPFWFHQTWTTILQIVIAVPIMFHSVGLATISALTVIVLTVLCNTPLAKVLHKYQSKLMMAQDEMLKAISEALSSMKVLKLYAWETHFKEVIEGLRKVEHKWLSAFQLRRAYNILLFWASPVLVSAATFSTCYFLRIPLNASNVFTYVATLRLVQEPIRVIPEIIAVVIQSNVAFTRVAKFLEEPELQIRNIRRKFEMGIQYEIFIKSANFSWDLNPSKPTLCNINLELKPGQKVAVCGEVGSGKSTLLEAILGEIPKVEGTIEVCGSIAYVSQTAWIQTGTIQENILFGSPMNWKKYQEVIEKCSLAKDLEMLPFGDLTEIGERGVNLSGGQKQRVQIARAVYWDADIYLLDDPFSAVDAHTATSLFNECIMGALSGKTVLLVTHQVDFLPAFDTILLMSDGEIRHKGSYAELLASSREFQDLVNAHQETVDTESLTKAAYLQRNDNITLAKEIKNMYTDNPKMGEASTGDQLIKQEEKDIGNTGLKPYILYLSQNKGFLYFSLATLCHLIFVIGQILQNSWMAANVQNSEVSTLRLISVYLVIGFSGTIFLFVRSVCVVVLGLESSKSLFSQLLKSLFHAPMSFFDSTPLGRILSRVSSDLSIVDLDVPFGLVFSVTATLNAYSNLGVLAVITWQVLFVSIPVVYLTIRLQRYYLASAKELMRINGTTKSLVANHLAESMLGAMTIRAFEQEEIFFVKNLNLIDKNGIPAFHIFAASEWLIQRLETMCATVLASSALVMTLLPSGTFSSGFIGMALSYGLSLNTSLIFSIQNQCTLANYIISVERLNQYMHIPSEAPKVIEGNRPGLDWPDAGKVEFHDLKIRYRPDTPLVLRGISCTFAGGHKIGIVGRTGSGKTTLISALFRLVEPVGGKIIIDGLDISKIGLHDIRSCLGIIPQDPTLFNGTVRFNLDPLRQHSDQELWEVLGKCQLRDTVGEKEDGLDSPVVEDGSNWSMGQRQLFCLGRALLKKSRILVLDEATASIDNATDSILQETIRTEFADCTVITVAHRIPTVMDCTMVLTMSDGKVVEYDKPLNLMKREGSLFGELVKEYWFRTTNAM